MLQKKNFKPLMFPFWTLNIITFFNEHLKKKWIILVYYIPHTHLIALVWLFFFFFSIISTLEFAPHQAWLRTRMCYRWVKEQKFSWRKKWLMIDHVDDCPKMGHPVCLLKMPPENHHPHLWPLAPLSNAIHIRDGEPLI